MMTNLEEIVKYSKKCIDNPLENGKKHIYACKRFLKDLNNPNFKFDEEEATRVVSFFQFLKHTKGVLAGEPIKLTSWQKFIVLQILCWKKTNGKRRFRKAFIEVGRKNSKTQLQAGICLYEMSVTATKNNEIHEQYCSGTKRDQSKILFEEAKNMIRGSLLEKKFKLTRDIIMHKKTNSFLKPLSKEDGKTGDGTNPAVLILDEYHQHPTTEFYDLFVGANTKEPLMIIITTAGVNLNAPCFTTEYKYCSEILEPNLDLENEEYFIDICEADIKDDVSNPNTWKKANPVRMTYQDGIDRIKSDYEVAKEVEEHMNTFLTKACNIWIQAQKEGYMNMEKWKACEVEEFPFDVQGLPVYFGFDLSSKLDLTSVTFILTIKKDCDIIYLVGSHSFIQSYEKLIEKCKLDKVPYDLWEKQGYITVTNSQVVDQEYVIKYFQDISKKYNWEIKNLCFDPANASKIMMDLERRGDYNIVEVYQSRKSLNESTRGFREEVYKGNVYFLKNPVLTYAMGNAIITEVDKLMKIDKKQTTKRIDPVDATLCAYKLAMYHEFEFNINTVVTDEYLDKLYKI